MDGSGIDFVEGGLTSEPAHSGAMRDQARAQAFQKWASRTHEVPIKPILIMLGIFVFLMGFPWVLDCLQEDKSEPSQQTEAMQAPAGDAQWAGNTAYPQFGQAMQPQMQPQAQPSMRIRIQPQMPMQIQQQMPVQQQPRHKVIVNR